jgi:fructokinase
MSPLPVEVVALGEALVDLVSTRSGVRLEAAPAFQKAAGGAPANVAVGLARLGRRVAFVGALATDPLGEFLAETLRRAGVSTSGICRSCRPTALALVAVAGDGDREFLFYGERPAHLELRLTPRMRALIRRARVLHVGSISLIAEPARSATLDAIRLARQAGVVCSYDPNLRRHLWADLPTARRRVQEVLRLADIVKVNAEELAFLTGTPSTAAGLRRLAAAGPRLAVATLGAAGCAYTGPGGDGKVPGYPARVADTTGAGDAFVAGMLHGLLAASPRGAVAIPGPDQLERILAFANATAALSTERRGGIPSLPSRRRVQAFLARRDRSGG